MHPGPSIIGRIQVAAALRTANFNFNTVVSRLCVEELGLTGEKAAEDLASSLGDLATKFDDTPPAKVMRMNKLTRRAQRNRKQAKGARAFVPGLHLTSMIRSIGLGNIQGFGSYNLGPHSVTCG